MRRRKKESDWYEEYSAANTAHDDTLPSSIEDNEWLTSDDDNGEKKSRAFRMRYFVLLGLVGLGVAAGVFLGKDQKHPDNSVPTKPPAPGNPDPDLTKTVAGAFTPRADGTAYLGTPESRIDVSDPTKGKQIQISKFNSEFGPREYLETGNLELAELTSDDVTLEEIEVGLKEVQRLFAVYLRLKNQDLSPEEILSPDLELKDWERNILANLLNLVGQFGWAPEVHDLEPDSEHILWVEELLQMLVDLGVTDAKFVGWVQWSGPEGAEGYTFLVHSSGLTPEVMKSLYPVSENTTVGSDSDEKHAAAPEATPDPSQIHVLNLDEAKNSPILTTAAAELLKFKTDADVLGVIVSPESDRFSEDTVGKATRIFKLWQDFTKHPVDQYELADVLPQFQDLSTAEQKFLADLLLPGNAINFSNPHDGVESVSPELAALVTLLMKRGGSTPLNVMYFDGSIFIFVDQGRAHLTPVPTANEPQTEAAKSVYPEVASGTPQVFSAEQARENGWYLFNDAGEAGRRMLVVVVAESTDAARSVLAPAMQFFQVAARTKENIPGWSPGTTDQVVLRDLSAYLRAKAERLSWSQAFIDLLCQYFGINSFIAPNSKPVTDPDYRPDLFTTLELEEVEAFWKVVLLLDQSGAKPDDALGMPNLGGFAAALTVAPSASTSLTPNSQ